MNHSIPNNIIDEIRSRSDIVEIVSDHVHLKKAGKNYKGLCPFHSEKTPSFSVSPDKQMYHCFGCGVGGNVFKFLMEVEDLSFVDSVKKLAASTHVVIPAPSRGEYRSNRHREREHLLKINSLAAEYFQSLLRHADAGKDARDYIQSRRFDDETLARYQIGWASPAWRDLLTWLEKAIRCSRADLEKAGLIIKKAGGGDYYDRFRGRVIFPLKDRSGNIVGFAGRVIADEVPKYLNSPETPLYKKGRQLFGLDGAKQAIRNKDSVLLVEGYFDQMRAVQHGIHNVVATCGTALTAGQAGLVKQLTSNVTLVFDSDQAGQSAAEKGFGVLLEQGMSVRIIVLPDGHDPDSFIESLGKESFLKQIEDAKPFIESYILRVVNDGNMRTPSGRLEAVNRILPLLSKVQNGVERSEWIRYLSEKIGVEDTALLAELKKALNRQQSSLRKAEAAAEKPHPELYLIHLLLADIHIARKIRSQLSVEELENPEYREIMQWCVERIDSGQEIDVHHLLDRTDNADMKSLMTKIVLKSIDFDNMEKAADDCINEIKRKRLEETIKNLKQQRNDAQKAGQTQRSREIHDRLREIQLSLIPG